MVIKKRHMANFVPPEISTVGIIPYGFRVCIYGSGSAGRTLLDELLHRRNDISVEFFLDSDKNSASIDGVMQLSINDYINGGFQHDLIIIASAYSNEISNTLNNCGIRNFTSYKPDAYTEQAMALVDLATLINSHGIHLIESFDELEMISDVLCLDFSSESIYIHNSLKGQKSIPTLDKAIHGMDFGNMRNNSFSIIQSLIKKNKINYVLFILTEASFNLNRFFIKIISGYNNLKFLLLDRSRKTSWIGLMLPDGNIGYVTIPKCGSSTMTAALSEAYINDYKTSDIRTYGDTSLIRFNEYRFDKKYKQKKVFFAIVRNPYNRLASLYHSHLSRGELEWMYYLGQKFNESPISFNSFCDYVYKCPDSLSDIHFKSQHTFLMDDNSEIFVKYLFKIEELDSSIGSINSLLPTPIKLYHLNRSKRKSDYMKMYYQDKMIKDKIYKRYRSDFTLLQYDR